MAGISKAEQRRPKHPTQHITKQMSGSKTKRPYIKYNQTLNPILRENMPLPEDLKMKLTFIALTHNITQRGLNELELVGKIKKIGNVTKEDEKIPRAVCNYYDVDYDRLLGNG